MQLNRKILWIAIEYLLDNQRKMKLIKRYILASIMHPNDVITASLALFFHRANNGLFSSTLIFFLLLNKTMETTKGETYTIAKEQAYIMDICKITVCSMIFKYFLHLNGEYQISPKQTVNRSKIGQMHLPRIQILHSTQREYIK